MEIQTEVQKRQLNIAIIVGIVILVLAGVLGYRLGSEEAFFDGKDQQQKNFDDTSASSTSAALPESPDRPSDGTLFADGGVILREVALDFDGDGQKEWAFLLSHDADGKGPGETVKELDFVIYRFDASEKKWKRAFWESPSGGTIVLGNDLNSAVEYFTATDLNRDGKQELLRVDRTDGTGQIREWRLFAWIKDEIQQVPLVLSDEVRNSYSGFIGHNVLSIKGDLISEKFPEQSNLSPVAIRESFFKFDGMSLLFDHEIRTPVVKQKRSIRRVR